ADQLVQAHAPREALAALATAARLDPANAPVARLTALAWLDLDRPAAAAPAALRVIREPDATAWDWALLGRVRARLADVAGAGAAIGRAIDLEPANDEWRRLLASVD